MALLAILRTGRGRWRRTRAYPRRSLNALGTIVIVDAWPGLLLLEPCALQPLRPAGYLSRNLRCPCRPLFMTRVPGFGFGLGKGADGGALGVLNCRRASAG